MVWCKVHGVKNLMVADASIIPFTVDGNTSAAEYLIGYTVARTLLRESRNRINRRNKLSEMDEE